jgi:hypothetical protein
VDRLVDAVGLRVESAAPLYPSSLSLPEAFDYLNAVWRLTLGNGEALFRISRAEAAAKLALECASVDELESRLSAIAGILSQIRLPGQHGDKKLVDLRDFLQQRFDRDSSERTTVAIGRSACSSGLARLAAASGRSRRQGGARRGAKIGVRAPERRLGRRVAALANALDQRFVCDSRGDRGGPSRCLVSSFCTGPEAADYCCSASGSGGCSCSCF